MYTVYTAAGSFEFNVTTFFNTSPLRNVTLDLNGPVYSVHISGAARTGLTRFAPMTNM